MFIKKTSIIFFKRISFLQGLIPCMNAPAGKRPSLSQRPKNSVVEDPGDFLYTPLAPPKNLEELKNYIHKRIAQQLNFNLKHYAEQLPYIRDCDFEKQLKSLLQTNSGTNLKINLQSSLTSAIEADISSYFTALSTLSDFELRDYKSSIGTELSRPEVAKDPNIIDDFTSMILNRTKPIFDGKNTLMGIVYESTQAFLRDNDKRLSKASSRYLLTLPSSPQEISSEPGILLIYPREQITTFPVRIDNSTIKHAHSAEIFNIFAKHPIFAETLAAFYTTLNAPRQPLNDPDFYRVTQDYSNNNYLTIALYLINPTINWAWTPDGLSDGRQIYDEINMAYWAELHKIPDETLYPLIIASVAQTFNQTNDLTQLFDPQMLKSNEFKIVNFILRNLPHLIKNRIFPDPHPSSSSAPHSDLFVLKELSCHLLKTTDLLNNDYNAELVDQFTTAVRSNFESTPNPTTSRSYFNAYHLLRLFGIELGEAPKVFYQHLEIYPRIDLRSSPQNPYPPICPNWEHIPSNDTSRLASTPLRVELQRVKRAKDEAEDAKEEAEQKLAKLNRRVRLLESEAAKQVGGAANAPRVSPTLDDISKYSQKDQEKIQAAFVAAENELKIRIDREYLRERIESLNYEQTCTQIELLFNEFLISLLLHKPDGQTWILKNESFDIDANCRQFFNIFKHLRVDKSQIHNPSFLCLNDASFFDSILSQLTEKLKTTASRESIIDQEILSFPYSYLIQYFSIFIFHVNQNMDSYLATVSEKGTNVLEILERENKWETKQAKADLKALFFRFNLALHHTFETLVDASGKSLLEGEASFEFSKLIPTLNIAWTNFSYIPETEISRFDKCQVGNNGAKLRSTSFPIPDRDDLVLRTKLREMHALAHLTTSRRAVQDASHILAPYDSVAYNLLIKKGTDYKVFLTMSDKCLQANRDKLTIIGHEFLTTAELIVLNQNYQELAKMKPAEPNTQQFFINESKKIETTLEKRATLLTFIKPARPSVKEPKKLTSGGKITSIPRRLNVGAGGGLSLLEELGQKRELRSVPTPSPHTPPSPVRRESKNMFSRMVGSIISPSGKVNDGAAEEKNEYHALDISTPKFRETAKRHFEKSPAAVFRNQKYVRLIQSDHDHILSFVEQDHAVANLFWLVLNGDFDTSKSTLSDGYSLIYFCCLDILRLPNELQSPEQRQSLTQRINKLDVDIDSYSTDITKKHIPKRDTSLDDRNIGHWLREFDEATKDIPKFGKQARLNPDQTKKMFLEAKTADLYAKEDLQGCFALCRSVTHKSNGAQYFFNPLIYTILDKIHRYIWTNQPLDDFFIGIKDTITPFIEDLNNEASELHQFVTTNNYLPEIKKSRSDNTNSLLIKYNSVSGDGASQTHRKTLSTDSERSPVLARRNPSSANQSSDSEERSAFQKNKAFLAATLFRREEPLKKVSSDTPKLKSGADSDSAISVTSGPPSPGRNKSAHHSGLQAFSNKSLQEQLLDKIKSRKPKKIGKNEKCDPTSIV